MARTVQTPRGVIAYDVRGDGDPLVLIPGMHSSSAAWIGYGYPEHLAGHRLIMIDPLGHGASDRSHDPDDYSIARTVEQITAVLDAEQLDRAPIMGFSRGGVIVAHMIDLVPERMVAAIIGAAPLGAAGDEAAATDDGIDALLAGDWAAYWRSYPVPLPDEVQKRFEATNDPVANGAARVAMRRWRVDNPDEGLGDVAVPRLVYFGSGEIFADPLRTLLVDRGVDYVERGWAGHVETFSDVAGVTTIVKDFLASIDR